MSIDDGESGSSCHSPNSRRHWWCARCQESTFDRRRPFCRISVTTRLCKQSAQALKLDEAKLQSFGKVESQHTIQPKVTPTRDTWLAIVRGSSLHQSTMSLAWGLEYLESGSLRSVLAYSLRRLLTKIQHRSSKISRKSEVCGAHWQIDA